MRFIKQIPLLVSLLTVASSCGDFRYSGKSSTLDEPGQPTQIFEKPYKTYTDEDRALFLPEIGDPVEDPKAEFAPFINVKDEYARLWNSIELRSGNIDELDWHLGKIVRGKESYKKVEAATGVPWWWVAITHGLEGSYDFTTHLHNGDPLSDFTFHVPANRPRRGSPPFGWSESAIDAIRYQDLHTWKSWDKIPVIAYAFESYNGFGYRGRINSPYLWSYTRHYSRGKYVSDGVWSSSAVSSQAGAMAILKRGLEKGIFSLNGSDTAGTAGLDLRKILHEGEKLYSGPSKVSAFCSNLATGTPVTVSSGQGDMLFVTLPENVCTDPNGKSVTKGWIQLSGTKTPPAKPLPRPEQLFKKAGPFQPHCAPGFKFDYEWQVCTDGVSVVGPFPTALTKRCENFGGNEHCAGPRWDLKFYKGLRGKDRCPAGSKFNETVGRCAEGDSAFGPFSDRQFESCINLKGKEACDTNRWHISFVK